MQLLNITKNTKLSELSEFVGSDNVASILHINNIERSPNIGQVFSDMCDNMIAETSDVSPDRKKALLNHITQDSDIFESAALGDSNSWKLLSSMNTLPNMLRIPEDVILPDSTSVAGNHEPVKSEIYDKVMQCLSTEPYTIDPSIFNDYSTTTGTRIFDYGSSTSNDGDPMQWFHIPWGEVSLYSSLSGEKIDFPVYPEEISNSAKANYMQMPDLIYQYEPWQLYSSSGPRSQTYSFEFHRDMWSGDHRDGRANALIRACEANCYPEYKGSAVYTSLVTLYISGSPAITGVMTDVNTAWSGPLGLDNFYLHCKLDITIVEVSQQVLDYETVRNKPLIG